MANITPDKVENWLSNTPSSIPVMNEERGSDTDAFNKKEQSSNIHHSNDKSTSSCSDSTTGNQSLKKQKLASPVSTKNRKSKQKLTKKVKKKAGFTNKKSKKIPLKSSASEIRIGNTQHKANIIDEEDSLHGTTDLGGTTIPAEPYKS